MIQLLDQNTINKIAAGEVIERPSSVVKELVENAVDAGATAITVDILDGGLTRIRITDNGSGIERNDIRTAFLRHYTSKIRGIDDLMTIVSLGFRGEALASIAAVSQVELITKTEGELTGIRYRIEGGMEKGFEEIGCPEGTTIIIDNIFFNTPVRKKFLKSSMTESAYIAEMMNKLALSKPHISFKLLLNHQAKLHTSGNNRLEDVIYHIYGKEISRNLIAVSSEKSGITVRGFIGKPSISRANRNYENYYINGRYVKSKVLQKALEAAYKSKLTIHQYPFCVLSIEVDPEVVDVNVHPTKMDVRFNQEQMVHDVICKIITDALHEKELIPEVHFEAVKKVDRPKMETRIPEPFEKQGRREFYEKQEKADPHTTQVGNKLIDSAANEQQIVKPVEPINLQVEHFHESPGTYPVESIKEVHGTYPAENGNGAFTSESLKGVPQQGQKEFSGNQVDYKDIMFTDKEIVKEHKIIGQLFNTYWVVELGDKYYVIDQHAAHERILYEKFLKKLEKKQSASQVLLKPLVVKLSMKEKQLLDEHIKIFDELGFEIEGFGGEDILIRSVPFIFEKPMEPADFIMILDTLDNNYQVGKNDILQDEIATMACKAAVKAHDKLSIIEYHQLIDDLLALENPFNCPHGRPTIISMTRYELEKKFKRIQ